jgi:hypothetical protein
MIDNKLEEERIQNTITILNFFNNLDEKDRIAFSHRFFIPLLSDYCWYNKNTTYLEFKYKRIVPKEYQELNIEDIDFRYTKI